MPLMLEFASIQSSVVAGRVRRQTESPQRATKCRAESVASRARPPSSDVGGATPCQDQYPSRDKEGRPEAGAQRY